MSTTPRDVLGAILGAGESNLGSAIDWFAGKPSSRTPSKRSVPLPNQGPVPDGVADSVLSIAQSLALDRSALDYAADRIKAGGYNAAAKNLGALRCFAIHEHGTDSKCMACDSGGKRVFLSCYATDEDGIARLLKVSRAASLSAPVAPLCPCCGKRDTTSSGPGLGDAAADLCAVCGAEPEPFDVGGYRSVEGMSKATDEGFDTAIETTTAAETAETIDGVGSVDGEIDDFLDAPMGRKEIDTSKASTVLEFLGLKYPNVSASEFRRWISTLEQAGIAVQLAASPPPHGAHELTGSSRVRHAGRTVQGKSGPIMISWEGLRAWTTRTDLGAEGTSDDLGYADVAADPAEKSFALLCRGWNKIAAWHRDASPLCPCRTQVGPLLSDWQAFAAKWTGGEKDDPSRLQAAWDGLKTAVKLRQRYAPNDDMDVETSPPAEGDSVSGWLEDAADFIASPITGGNKPSPEAEGKVQEVAAVWASLKPKMDGDPKVARELKAQYDHWVKFYGEWRAGSKDVTDLNAVVADANVARRNYLKIDQSTDKEPIKGIDIETEREKEMKQGAKDAAKKAAESAAGAGKMIALGAAAALAALAALKSLF